MEREKNNRIVMVQSPGACGEFIQGSIEGKPFLITCPIDRFSYACYGDKPSDEGFVEPWQEKTLKAIAATLSYIGEKALKEPLYVKSDIVQGKGMASSSADITAAAYATALQFSRHLTMKELETIAISIEPSDATFYKGIVAFDYLEGRFTKELGNCPPLVIVVFDEGGAVDTLRFNDRSDLQEKISDKEKIISQSVDMFMEALSRNEVTKLGEAVTMSSFANQDILCKKDLSYLHEIGQQHGAIGTIVAHSGTVMGLLFAENSLELQRVLETVKEKIPTLEFMDIVKTYNGGITYTEELF